MIEPTLVNFVNAVSCCIIVAGASKDWRWGVATLCGIALFVK